MAYRVLEMLADLSMSGTRKARQEMAQTEKSANSLKRALEAVDRAADGWNRVERGLDRIRDAITKTRAAAAKPIVVKVELEGDREVIQRLQTLRRLLGSLGNNSPPIKVEADTRDARQSVTGFVSWASSQSAKVSIGADVRDAQNSVRTLKDYIDRLRASVDVGAEDGEARETVQKLLSWASEQSSKITIGADTADAQNSAEILKTYIDRLTANINVRAQIKSAVAALEFVRTRASKITGEVQVDADTSPALAKIEALVRAASGIEANVKVSADTDDATRGLIVVRNLRDAVSGTVATVRANADTGDATRSLGGVQAQARAVEASDPNVRATADTSDATRGLGNVLRIGGMVSSYKPNMTVNASVGRALAALVGIRITGRSISREGVVINVSTEGTPITQAQLDAVRAKAMQLGATRATVRVDQNGALATTFQLQGVNAAANQLNGRRVSFRVDAQGAKIIPVVLGDAISQLQKLQSFMAVVSAVGLPAFITGLAGAAGTATALAGAVGSLAIGLGQGLVGAAGAAASAATLGAGALGAYGFAMFKTLSYAFNLTTMLDDQRRKIEDSAEAVLLAKKAVDSATPGTREYTTAVRGLALAEQNAEYEQRKFNAMLSFATPRMIELNKEAGNLSIGFTRLGGTVANEVAPVTTSWIRGLVNLLPTVTPHLVEMVGRMNGVADSFVKTMSRGRELANLTTIFVGIKSAGVPAMQILTNILRIFVNVFSATVPTGLKVLDVFARLTGAAAKWSGTAEGQRRIGEVWAMLVGRGQQLWSVFKNLAASAAGLYTALNNSGTVDRLMAGLVSLTGQFRELLAVGGQWNTNITQAMQNAEPVLTALWGLAKELANQFFRVAGAVLDMGGATGNVETLVAVIDSLAASAKPLADLLIGEFEHFGPLLPPLILNVGKLTETFLKSTPMLLGFTDVMNTLLTAFTSLDPRTQRVSASMLAFTSLIVSSGAPALLGYAGQMGTNIALITAMRANTIALTGAENVGMLTRIRATASLVAQKVATVAVSAATKAYAAGQWLLNAALTANPIGIVIVFLAALVAGLVLAYRHSESFRNIVNSAFGALKTVAITNVKALQFAVQAAWNWIKTNTPPVWNAVKAAVLGAWNGIKTTVQTNVQIIRTVVNTAWNIISQTTTRVFNGIKSYFGGLWIAIKGVFTGNTSQIKSGLSRAWAAMKQITGAAWNGIKALFGVVWAGIKAVFSNSTAGLRRTVQAAWTAIRSATASVWNGIKALLGGIWRGLGALARTAFNAIKTAISAIWRATQTATRTVWNGIRLLLSGIWRGLSALARTAFNAIKVAISAAWRAIQSSTRTVWNGIRTVLATVWNGIKSLTKSAIAAVRSAVSTAWNFIRTTTTQVWNSIKQFFATFWANQRRGFTVILNFLKNAVSTAWNFIRTTTTRVYNAVRDFFSAFWTNQRRSFTSATDFLKNLISRSWEAIKSTTSRVWNAIRSFFSGWWTRMRELFTSTIEALKKRLSDGWTSMFTRAREFGGNLLNLLRDRFLSIRNAVMDRLNNLKSSASDLWTSMWRRAGEFGDNIRRLLADKFASAVNGVRKYLGLLSSAMGNVLAAIGMDKLASDLRSQGTRMQSPIRFAKGGIAGGSQASASGGPGGVQAFARGGMGTTSAQPKVHMWNEQKGREGYAVENRPAREQLPFIKTMAGWFDHAVVPANPASFGASAGFAEGGVYPLRAFAGGGIGALYNAVKSKFGVEGFNRHTYLSFPASRDSLDFMVTTPGNRAEGAEKTLGDNIAAFTAPPSSVTTIWYGRANYGSGWQNYNGSAGVGNSNTLGHYDHPHVQAFPDQFRGAQGTFSGGGGGIGGAISSVIDKLGKTWNSVTDFMSNYFKPPSIPDVGLGKFGGGIKDYLGTMAGKVKDWLTDKASSLLGIGDDGGSVSGNFSGDQKQVALEFAKNAVSRGIPGRLPVMTALVESGMRNLNYGDRDSVGYFQQRTSQGWGSISQLMDPAYALDAFLDVAAPMKGRYANDAGGLGAWAQAVQRSAFPDRYAQQYNPAASLIGDSKYYGRGGIIPGIEGAKKLVMGHAGERVLPIPAVDAFDRLSNSLVLWSRNTPSIGTTMGAARALPVVPMGGGGSGQVNINITQDFTGMTVGEGSASVEEIMEMARRGGEEGARAALAGLGATRHKVSNRIASRRS